MICEKDNMKRYSLVVESVSSLDNARKNVLNMTKTFEIPEP